jgi:hypothetical protein
VVNLFLRERKPKHIEVLDGGIQGLPIEVQRASRRSAQRSGEVLVNNMSFVSVRRSPSLILM